MNRQDWTKIEDRLRFPGAQASLRVDGRDVCLAVRTCKMKMVIQVFIDGWTRGEWLNVKEPCPEQAFMKRHERYLWSKKERDAAAKFAKRWGKREAKKYMGDRDNKFVCFLPYFPSVRAIRTQYEKTFKSIDLVES